MKPYLWFPVNPGPRQEWLTPPRFGVVAPHAGSRAGAPSQQPQQPDADLARGERGLAAVAGRDQAGEIEARAIDVDGLERVGRAASSERADTLDANDYGGGSSSRKPRATAAGDSPSWSTRRFMRRMASASMAPASAPRAATSSGRRRNSSPRAKTIAS
jgi:hypothetical protein